MLSESMAGSRVNAGSHAFWWRLADNLFRRIVWFLIPVLVLTAVGVGQALNTLEVYGSTGTLSASANPLVPEQTATGINAQFWESPAAATSRIINERLRTNTFLTDVAEAAGLGESLQNGLFDLSVVRSSVYASANGDSILTINATWADAQTSYELVAATIKEYEAFITETVASNSSEAVTFYTDQLTSLQPERDAADRALAEYVASLPDLDEGAEYPIDVQVEITGLTNKLTALDGKIATAEQNIDTARLAQSQRTTEAGRSFTVIDEPRVPGAPESTLMKRVMLVISFMLLGVVIALAALLVTTVLDQSVASSADLLAIGGITLVATVPPVRFAGQGRKPRSLSRRRASALATRPAR